MPRPLSPLELALLGLLAPGPASGYDLRQVFQTTALGNYSDSPGSIYPALERLQTRKLVKRISSPTNARRRRPLGLTPLGRRTLAAWIALPVRATDLLRDSSLVDLRLAFVSAGDPRRLPGFLQEYAAAAVEAADSLTAAFTALGPKLSPSASLALALGTTLARARLQWSREAGKELVQ